MDGWKDKLMRWLGFRLAGVGGLGCKERLNEETRTTAAERVRGWRQHVRNLTSTCKAQVCEGGLGAFRGRLRDQVKGGVEGAEW